MDDYGFKFKVGDTVRFKCLRLTKESRALAKRPKGMVLERLLQECPGGIQRHYELRIFHDSGYDSAIGSIHRFNEIELEKYEPQNEEQNPKETTV